MIIKYIPLQQGLRLEIFVLAVHHFVIIKYIPLQQGLRPSPISVISIITELLSIFHYNKD